MQTYPDTRPFVPDYTGVFRMLYIAAWVFAVAFSVTGAVLVYGLFYGLKGFEMTWIPGSEPFLGRVIRVGGPLAVLATGALLLAAATLGRSGSNAGRRFLAAAAILMLILRLGAFAIAMTSQSTMSAGPSLPFDSPAWQMVLIANGTVFSLVYPLLCIVALMASRRSLR